MTLLILYADTMTTNTECLTTVEENLLADMSRIVDETMKSMHYDTHRMAWVLPSLASEEFVELVAAIRKSDQVRPVYDPD